MCHLRLRNLRATVLYCINIGSSATFGIKMVFRKRVILSVPGKPGRGLVFSGQLDCITSRSFITSSFPDDNKYEGTGENDGKDDNSNCDTSYGGGAETRRLANHCDGCRRSWGSACCRGTAGSCFRSIERWNRDDLRWLV